MGFGFEVPPHRYAVDEHWESSNNSTMKMQPRPEPGCVYSKPHIFNEDHHMHTSPMHHGGKRQGPKMQHQNDHHMQTSPMHYGGNWQDHKVQHQRDHHMRTSPPMYCGGNWQGHKVQHQRDWYGPKTNHGPQCYGYGSGYNHKPVIPTSHERTSFDKDFYGVPVNVYEVRYEHSSGARGYLYDERDGMTSGGHSDEWVSKGI